MTALADVFIQGRIDSSKFGPDIKSGMSSPGVRSSMDKAGKEQAGRFSSGFKSALKMGGILAGAFAATKGVEFFKDAVAGASDLQENVSKVGVVFGQQSAKIIAASKDSATAMGLSKNAYLEANGTLGNLLVSLKIAPERAANMSQQMVKLAGDLASFNNASPEEALNALKSGLVGETEPLKRFGVNMNEATLKAEALAQGILKPIKDGDKIKAYYAKSTIAQAAYNDAVAEFGPKSLEALKAQTTLGIAQSGLEKATKGTLPPLTAQQKALAAQGLIMKQTATAQGDFKRTSGGLANQQRILKAQFDDVKASVGKGLLPIVTKFALFLNQTGIPAIRDTAGWIKKNQDWLVPLVGTIGAAAVVYKTITTATKVWAAAQAILNVVLTANPIGIVIAALAALGVGLYIAWKKSDKFRAVVKFAFNEVKDAVQTATLFVADKVLWMAEKMLGAMDVAFSWVPGLGGKIKKAKDAITGLREHLNSEMDKMNDEDVNIRIKASTLKAATNFVTSGDLPGAGGFGGAGRIPSAAAAIGGAGSLDLKADTSGARAGIDRATASAQMTAAQIAKEMAKQAKAAIGPMGKAGRVLPRGSYSIGMPYHGYPGHNGADYPAPTGTPIFAPWAGQVITSANLGDRSYGRYVKIAHGNGLTTLYAHMSQLGIGAGASVRPGQFIGRVGEYGNATGPHLHFESARNGVTFDPKNLGLFDRGGIMRGLGINLSGQPERVLSPRQTQNFERMTDALDRATSRAGSGGGPAVINVYDVDGRLMGSMRGEIGAERTYRNRIDRQGALR